MIDSELRKAIFTLQKKDQSLRAIARTLKLSRNTVRQILRNGHVETPERTVPDQTEPHLPLVRDLFARCQGNRVRVQEELEGRKIVIPYSTLTAGLRRLGIGVEVKQPAGEYVFGPGVEMQHDTSPHDVELGGRRRGVQTASLVLGYSRWRFMQCYPTWNRFWCKVFLTDALVFFGGAAHRCVLDNSSVIIVRGTGKAAVPAPEMEAFSRRFDFNFIAHELGDVNRSAKVERPFWHFERNFLAGRTFTDWDDLNREARAWCERISRKFRKRLRGSPLELFRSEQPSLRPLPAYVPEVYALESRIVDLEGYIHLYGNRYSAPARLLGATVEVRAYKNRVVLFDGRHEATQHARSEDGLDARVSKEEHRIPRRKPGDPPRMTPEEKVLRGAGAEIAALTEMVKSRHDARALRRLYRLYIDYPLEALQTAAVTALTFGLHDMARIERVVLRTLQTNYFRIPTFEPDDSVSPAEKSDHGRQPRPAPAQPKTRKDPPDPPRGGQEGDEGEGEL
jgi:hypothetical protein